MNVIFTAWVWETAPASSHTLKPGSLLLQLYMPLYLGSGHYIWQYYGSLLFYLSQQYCFHITKLAVDSKPTRLALLTHDLSIKMIYSMVAEQKRDDFYLRKCLPIHLSTNPVKIVPIQNQPRVGSATVYRFIWSLRVTTSW